jgi:hypothetical protein
LTRPGAAACHRGAFPESAFRAAEAESIYEARAGFVSIIPKAVTR